MAKCKELADTQEAQSGTGIEANVEEVLGLPQGHNAALLPVRGGRASGWAQYSQAHAGWDTFSICQALTPEASFN